MFKTAPACPNVFCPADLLIQRAGRQASCQNVPPVFIFMPSECLQALLGALFFYKSFA
jgi:hypothetical protein